MFSYGVGSRIKLKHTRKIIDAIHSGSLLNAEYKKTEVFDLEIPTQVDGVPSEILDPVNTVSSFCSSSKGHSSSPMKIKSIDQVILPCTMILMRIWEFLKNLVFVYSPIRRLFICITY